MAALGPVYSGPGKNVRAGELMAQQLGSSSCWVEQEADSRGSSFCSGAVSVPLGVAGAGPRSASPFGVISQEATLSVAEAPVERVFGSLERAARPAMPSWRRQSSASGVLGALHADRCLTDESTGPEVCATAETALCGQLPPDWGSGQPPGTFL